MPNKGISEPNGPKNLTLPLAGIPGRPVPGVPHPGRGIAARVDKTAHSYLAALILAAAPVLDRMTGFTDTPWLGRSATKPSSWPGPTTRTHATR
jgi:hypothetical protein